MSVLVARIPYSHLQAPLRNKDSIESIKHTHTHTISSWTSSLTNLTETISYAYCITCSITEDKLSFSSAMYIYTFMYLNYLTRLPVICHWPSRWNSEGPTLTVVHNFCLILGSTISDSTCTCISDKVSLLLHVFWVSQCSHTGVGTYHYSIYCAHILFC